MLLENSKKKQLYGKPASLTSLELQRLCSPNKAMISEYGWIYLIGDASNFIPMQLGEISIGAHKLNSLREKLTLRRELFSHRGFQYHMFLIPEKSVVYPEYLPRALIIPQRLPIRPSEILHLLEPASVTYLGLHLQDAKSLGQIFFKGDSHANWLGAWEVYNLVAQRLAIMGVIKGTEILPLGALDCSIAAWDGDISSQIGANLAEEFRSSWSSTLGSNAIEAAIARNLPQSRRQSFRTDCPGQYKEWFRSRPTVVYERLDRGGMKAVIFRDSAIDLLTLDLLAQHFARSVFVWHKGLIIENVLETENPDVVIQIMTERFVVAHANGPVTSRIEDDRELVPRNVTGQ